MGWFDEPKPRRKRKAIPQDIRLRVWNRYFPGTTVGKCYVCRDPILLRDFQVGHNKADASGGSLALSNLRPICGGCNRAMGTMSIEVYRAKYYGKPKPTSKTKASDTDARAKLEMKVSKHLASKEYNEMTNKHGFDMCAVKDGGILSGDKLVAVQLNHKEAVTASDVRAFVRKVDGFAQREAKRVLIAPTVFGLMAYTGEAAEDVTSLVQGTRVTLKRF